MYWSFDGAHPALAKQHYLRTSQQNEALEWERVTAQGKLDMARAAAAEFRRRALLKKRQCRSASPRMPAPEPSCNLDDAMQPATDLRVGEDGTSGICDRPRRHASWDVDISQVQSQSAEVAARAEKVLQHSLHLAEGCKARNLDALCTDLPPQACQGIAQEHQKRGINAEHALNQPEDLHHANSPCSGIFHAGSTVWPGEGVACAPTQTTEKAGRPCGGAGDDLSSCGQQVDSCSQSCEPAGMPFNEAVASGKYSADRYAEYNKGLEEDMQIRMQAGQEMGNLAAGQCRLLCITQDNIRCV